MSDFTGLASVTIDGERVAVEHINIETQLSDAEVFGTERRECDECGGLIHPTEMVMTASTDAGRGGVYHGDCTPERGEL